MKMEQIEKHSKCIAPAILVILMIAAFYIKFLPALHVGTADILNFVGSDDPLYNLRQVELMLHNNLTYSWFDPSTFIPYGMILNWGPVFPTILSIACLITGATTRPDIIQTCLAIPPIMAALMIPIIFFITKKLTGDWKIGLIGSLFIAFMTGQYFTRSLWGYLDHHIAEVLFSTIFCALYIFTIYKTKESKNLKSWKEFILPIITGISYAVGLFVMPTMVLFAFIVSVYTLFQIVLDSYRKEVSDYLLFTNIIIFSVASILFIAFRPPIDYFALSHYSIAHAYALMAIIAETVGLWYLSRTNKNTSNLLKKIGVLFGAGLTFAISSVLFFKPVYDIFILGAVEFFGVSSYSTTVQEARSWTFVDVWNSFNFSIILAIIGIGILAYYIYKKQSPVSIFVASWGIIIFVATIQHIRYEYYLAPIVSILAAISAGFVVKYCLPMVGEIGKNNKKEEKTEESSTKKNKKKKKGDHQKTVEKDLDWDYYKKMGSTVSIAFTAILVILFLTTSISFGVAIASGGTTRMNSDWKESMEWLPNNTPDTGVDYYKIYDKNTFKYSDDSYGIMSWWDYGHMITYIGKRIPNANPFQSGVLGEGAARFFMSTNETETIHIADDLRTKYVVTDIEMATTKLWAMATWDNSSIGVYPYQQYYLAVNPQNTAQTQPVMVYMPAYFNTMIARLHNFDGSMMSPEQVVYVEVSIDVQGAPKISRALQFNYTDAITAVEQYNKKNTNNIYARSFAAIVSPDPLTPSAKVPALQHWRLVHESPSTVISGGNVNVKYVKTFEYVKGKEIFGEGIIETNITTNTGRIFTYRQESENGKFVVPYPGTYRFGESDKTVVVKESEIN